ncbi:MAG: hypothetical protein OEU32_06445 [Acidimicrobiia bacterium]|nr:hypothetical protein [Acidimicrobiia bacterium]
MEHRSVTRSFLVGLADAMGIDRDVLDRVGTTVAPGSDRAGTGVASCYRLGEHTVIWCDPVLNDRLAAAIPAGEQWDAGRFAAWATGEGAEPLGRAVMHVLEGQGPSHEMPDGVRLRWLDRGSERDVAQLTAFCASCTVDEVESAEIDLGDLDPRIVVAVDDDGAIGAYASALPWEYDEGFDDIGVLSRPDVRRRGWTAAALGALIERQHALRLEPLYRCDTDNDASMAVAHWAGFVPATELTAVCFGAGPQV